ncbi:hypothetical protein Syun_017673 [Stephania yunnanensis]|uniref:Uncharacterized protein n=1 Tax=Stephania yunnanensis TaxID=152371 RepID=A0AAP0P631_9MAGN
MRVGRVRSRAGDRRRRPTGHELRCCGEWSSRHEPPTPDMAEKQRARAEDRERVTTQRGESWREATRRRSDGQRRARELEGEGDDARLQKQKGEAARAGEGDETDVEAVRPHRRWRARDDESWRERVTTRVRVSEIDPKIKRACSDVSITLIGPYLLTQSTTNNNKNQRLLRREEPELLRREEPGCGEKNQSSLRREEPEIVAERRTRDRGEKNQRLLRREEPDYCEEGSVGYIRRGEGRGPWRETQRREKEEGTALRERQAAVHTRGGEGREEDCGGTEARSGGSGGSHQQQRQWYVKEVAVVVRIGRNNDRRQWRSSAAASGGMSNDEHSGSGQDSSDGGEGGC